MWVWSHHGNSLGIISVIHIRLLQLDTTLDPLKGWIRSSGLCLLTIDDTKDKLTPRPLLRSNLGCHNEIWGVLSLNTSVYTKAGISLNSLDVYGFVVVAKHWILPCEPTVFPLHQTRWISVSILNSQCVRMTETKSVSKYPVIWQCLPLSSTCLLSKGTHAVGMKRLG